MTKYKNTQGRYKSHENEKSCCDLVGEAVKWNGRSPFEVSRNAASFQATFQPRLGNALCIWRPYAIRECFCQMTIQSINKLHTKTRHTEADAVSRTDWLGLTALLAQIGYIVPSKSMLQLKSWN